jgi:hypothetical protein
MLQIKEEFKKLIPALSVEEFNQLEANCLAEGIREKIITWEWVYNRRTQPLRNCYKA